MAGHSKWANIKRAKEATDAKRSSTFSKLSKDIVIAARLGQTGDLNMNPMLRVAVSKARSANLPNDKIDKAINKGLGILDSGDQSQEKVYEAYSSDGIGMLIDVETDNANRSLTDIRTIVNKSGGKMASEGSISWQFREMGFVRGSINKVTNKELEDVSLSILVIDGVIDLNVITFIDNVLSIEIYTAKESLKSINDKLNELFHDNFELSEMSLIKKKQGSDVDLTDKFMNLVASIKEIEDVSNVWY
jgi:YebC/PmpR family DNA-binding regulatory protein